MGSLALRWMASFQEVLHPRAGEELRCSGGECSCREHEPHAESDSEDSSTGVVAMANRSKGATAANEADDLTAVDQDGDDDGGTGNGSSTQHRHPRAAAALAAAARAPPSWPLLKTSHHPITEDGWRLHLLHVRIDPEALRAAEEEAAKEAERLAKNSKKGKAAPAAPAATAPPPLPPKKKRQHPILMVPGLASAGEPTFDLPPLQEHASLAEDLARRGWDVWIADLRGNGRADRPLAPPLLRPWSSPARWTVDTHLELDAPCVLSYVLIQTRTPSLHWVGHSMGGMLGCGLLSHPLLARRFAGRVRSLTLLASGCFGAGAWHHRGNAVVRALTRVGGFPAGLAGRGLAAVNLALAGKGGLRAGEGLFFWPPNMEPRVGRALLRDCFSWMPPTLVGHFLASLSDEHGLRRAGSRRDEVVMCPRRQGEGAGAAASKAPGEQQQQQQPQPRDDDEAERRFLLYADPGALAATAVPVFALNGDRDLFCPAAGALRTVRMFAGERACRRFLCLGKSRGNAELHYGHFDVICGRRAPEEAWPHLARWLDEHDGTRPVEAFEEAGIARPTDADLVGGGGGNKAAGAARGRR